MSTAPSPPPRRDGPASAEQLSVRAYCLDLDCPVTCWATGWGPALKRDIKVSVQSTPLPVESPRSGLGAHWQHSHPGAQLFVSRMVRRRAVDACCPPGHGPTPGARPEGEHHHDSVPAAAGHHQAAGPALLRAAAAAGEPGFGRSGRLFPSQPFPYQYQGIAFLYPRYAAILADEMGLGKTMQAITAARLLLRSGEVRSLLLICPKPLVTNWQREFALWAPELPVGVIEGDQARRRWQWEQTNVPVEDRQLRIAAARCRAVSRPAGGTSTWSCWTKRSGSRTAPARPARWCARFPGPAPGR